MDIVIDGLAKEAMLDEEKVNNGVWVHLDSAVMDADGQYPPLYLGGDTTKPQRALVRSYRCKAIKEAEQKRQKNGFVKIRMAKKADRDGVIAESSILPEADRFALLLVALDNFGKAGGVQQVSEADAKALHGMTAMDSIVEQIRQAAYDDDLFMATVDTPQGNGSAASTMTKPTPPPTQTAET